MAREKGTWERVLGWPTACDMFLSDTKHIVFLSLGNLVVVFLCLLISNNLLQWFIQ